MSARLTIAWKAKRVPRSSSTANFFGDSVSAKTIDAATGGLTAIGGAPFAAGLNPGSIAIRFVIENGPQAALPVINAVELLRRPFRINIRGGNFQPGVRIYIGSDASPGPASTSRTRPSSSSAGAGPYE